jgi:hypothetical protein
MKEAVKLLTAGLGLVVLMGCGGGGGDKSSVGVCGGSSATVNKEAEKLGESFPPFNIKAPEASINLAYYVSLSEINKFKESLKNKGFLDNSDDNYDSYYKEEPCYIYVDIYPSNNNIYYLTLAVDNENGDVGIGIFDDFGPINATFSTIYITRTYHGNITSSFAAYISELEAAKWNIKPSGSDTWEKNAGGFDYIWSYYFGKKDGEIVTNVEWRIDKI